MDETPGPIGTAASLSLRLGQFFFSTASLLLMSFGTEFYSYTAFCFLVTIMGLLIPWSAALVIIDLYTIFVGCRRFHLPGVMFIIVLGDMTLSILALAASCATAGVVDFLIRINGSYCSPKYYGRFQLSTAMAFFAWVVTAAAFLFNLWHWLIGAENY